MIIWNYIKKQYSKNGKSFLYIFIIFPNNTSTG